MLVWSRRSPKELDSQVVLVQLGISSEGLWSGQGELLMKMTELVVMTKLLKLVLSSSVDSKRSFTLSLSSIFGLWSLSQAHGANFKGIVGLQPILKPSLVLGRLARVHVGSVQNILLTYLLNLE